MAHKAEMQLDFVCGRVREGRNMKTGRNKINEGDRPCRPGSLGLGERCTEESTDAGGDRIRCMFFCPVCFKGCFGGRGLRQEESYGVNSYEDGGTDFSFSSTMKRRRRCFGE